METGRVFANYWLMGLTRIGFSEALSAVTPLMPDLYCEDDFAMMPPLMPKARERIGVVAPMPSYWLCPFTMRA